MSTITKDGHELHGLVAEFDDVTSLTRAAEKVRDAGYTRWDCYTPFPVHGLDKAMGIRMTILPWVVFLGGLGGLLGGLLLEWWTNAHFWPWLVSGKPYFSLPANIPIAFECTILASVLTSFFAMWGMNKLPAWYHPFFNLSRFVKVTDDKFFLGIEAGDPEFDAEATRALLEEGGAAEVEDCWVESRPKGMPKPVIAFIIVSAVMGLVPFALIAKARADKSRQPHWHIIPDMDFQAKRKPQGTNDFFLDGRTARQPVEGTVARGEARLDDHFYRGLDADGDWADTFPPRMEITKRTMRHGKERFEIYCAPCHGASGGAAGKPGMIGVRLGSVPRDASKFAPPANLHDEAKVLMPNGQIFNTITNGYNTMPAYGAQIPAEDRWAIILYVRALQRSQKASINDVPADKRGQVKLK